MPYLTVLYLTVRLFKGRCFKVFFVKGCGFKMLGSVALLTSAHAVGSADLRVTVEGSAQPGAPFYFALYDDPQAFEEREEGIRMAVVNTWVEQPSVAFTDLPSGQYVVAVFQDLNGNGELDTNLMGQPTEPYALSGSAADGIGPPRFDDAAIQIDSDSTSIRIELRK